MQKDAPETGWGQGSAGGRCCVQGVPHSRSWGRAGGSGAVQPEPGSLGTHGLAAVQREATQVIKGTGRLISERRLKGLNIYIAWLRAVRGETN